MHNVTPNNWMRGAAVALALALFAMVGCRGVTAQSSKSRQSSRATTDCASCYRLCDVGGKAQKNNAKVAACKADCDKKCQ